MKMGFLLVNASVVLNDNGKMTIIICIFTLIVRIELVIDWDLPCVAILPLI